MKPVSYPSYLSLRASGELSGRAKRLREIIKSCELCPRKCRIDRTAGQRGYCRAGESARVASHNVHTGEEPPISGTRGSGTVFFAHCTMRCLFCQNFPISQQGHGVDAVDATLADHFLELQKAGCHNLNLVTPTHYSHAFVAALGIAAEKDFRLPIVYNTSGYESVEILRLLDGVVDIYMPDIKYVRAEDARHYSDAQDYCERNLEALKEMQRQVGDLELDDEGIARRGLLVRHLVLPGIEEQSVEALRRVMDEVSPTAFVSLMSQYFPAHKAHDNPPLDRRVSPTAYAKVVEFMEESSLNGWIQPML